MKYKVLLLVEIKSKNLHNNNEFTQRQRESEREGECILDCFTFFVKQEMKVKTIYIRYYTINDNNNKINSRISRNKYTIHFLS